MNILGISGFEDAVPFKKAAWPGLSDREYRISQGHDAAAALVVDGVTVAAAAEERFNRQKHSARFPIQAIQACLDQAGLEMGDIDEIAHSFDYSPYRAIYSFDPSTASLYRHVYSPAAVLDVVNRYLPGWPGARFHPVPHHLAHAASAYYTSGWNECLVVVADGMGEAHSASVYSGANGGLQFLAGIPGLDSLGVLYSLVTLHLGFEFNSDEYKIMGLAPYGDPRRFRRFFEDAVDLRANGGLRIPLLRRNRTREERENYTASRHYLAEHLVPARHPEEEITQDHRDVAASLQECLDKAMLHVCESFRRLTGARRLALAGGVALNCTTNGALIKSGLFEDVYIQPAAGDDGSALGAALYRAALAGESKNVRSATPFFGPGYSPSDVLQALGDFHGRIRVERFQDLEATCTAAARLIAQGRVIAWYRGRMEFGPRALGHRSILADPSDPGMRDRINAMVKMREAFRPFAPAVSLEEAYRWFDIAPMTEQPYMITTVDVREPYRSQLPAITHVNGSARIQTVAAHDNYEFHRLLKAVGRETGREIVLNTSFNVKGQPIVNTPREAVYTFLGTGIEFLFLEDFLISRESGPTEQDRHELQEALAVV